MSTVYIYIAQQLLHLCLQLLRGTNVIAHCHSHFLDDFCTCFLFIACFTWPMVKMAHDCDRFLSLTGQWAFCKNCRLCARAFSPLKCLPEGSSWNTRYILGVCCLSGRLISDGFVVCCVICCFCFAGVVDCFCSCCYLRLCKFNKLCIVTFTSTPMNNSNYSLKEKTKKD